MKRVRFGFVLVLMLCFVQTASAASVVLINESLDNDGDGVMDDQGLVDWLIAEGHDVDVQRGTWQTLDAGQLDQLNAADLVIMSRSSNSGNYDDAPEPTQWNSVTTPLIQMSAYLVRNNRWLWVNSGTINNISLTDIEVVVPNHPIFNGVTLNNNVVNSHDNSVGTGDTSLIGTTDMGNGTLLAQSGANAVIAEWQPDIEFYNSAGQTPAGKRLMFLCGTQEAGATPQGAFNLTDNGQIMLRNAMAYLLGISFEAAGNPKPGNGEEDVLLDHILTWQPGRYAETHDVYFGTTFEDVNDASRTNPGNVLVSQGQAQTRFDPGRLALGQTYFWRIDEVNAAPDNTIYRGKVWNFTAEPVSYPLPSDRITATASSSIGDDPNAPSRTIDGSGLDDNDGHSNLDGDMWLSASSDTDPWVQYEFDQVYKLDRMLVWNSNQTAEAAVGWGFKDVQIETSLDGETWTVVEDVNQLAQAAGLSGTGPTDDIDLGGIPAQCVRISIISNWGGLLPQYGLSEVRFYTIPVQVREPQPAPGTNDVLPNAVLSWRAGREAGIHDVFVGTDANAVLDGSASFQTVTDNSFDLASLDLPIGETYFWKVNEVNDVEDPSVWEGPLWDFTIPDPLVVDDFEGYSTNNIATRPYVTWRDGLPYSNPAPGGEGNGTGAIVGHDIFSPGSPFFDGDLMELSLIHGGTQSLPLYYDNSGNGGNEPYSEMTRTFSPAQDWSGNAIATLTLYFRGVEGNTGQLYVKINDTKLSYTDDPGAISRPMWEQWNIDLASTGADLSNVQSLTVGIENAGSGLVYVDDILLYRDAPVVAQGIDPGNAGLVASYSMENNVDDDTGNYNGTATGNPLYETGYSGMALSFDGVDDYVELPIGSVISSQPDMTVTSWVNWSGEGDAWQRIFDFGTGTTEYMFLTPNSGPGTVRFAITTDGGGEAEYLVNGLTALPTDWHHVAVTLDSSTMTVTLYVDGSVVGSGPTELLPQDLSETTQNWLGDSQYTADPFFEGSLDDFLIYDRALSEAEIRYLAGER